MSSPCFQHGVPLALHTTFRIGGPAQAFFMASSADDVIKAAWKAEGMGLQWYVMGHGSNLLVSDTGYSGAVIAFRDESPPGLNPDNTIQVSGGADLRVLVRFCAEHGLGGLEDLAGIPGTVGGAIAGNAGAYGNAIGDAVKSVLLLDRNGGMRRASGSELSFAYRSSALKASGEVVLEATMVTRPDRREAVIGAVEERLADRKKKHPDWRSVATAGSYFRNPTLPDGSRIAAGRLLEQAGCMDLSVGGARPWRSHANIIVTDGSARASDVLALADGMAQRVKEVHGISLCPEVVYLE